MDSAENGGARDIERTAEPSSVITQPVIREETPDEETPPIIDRADFPAWMDVCDYHFANRAPRNLGRRRVGEVEDEWRFECKLCVHVPRHLRRNMFTNGAVKSTPDGWAVAWGDCYLFVVPARRLTPEERARAGI